MKLRLYRNTSARRWGYAKLPVRQRCLWIGPLFVLVQH